MSISENIKQFQEALSSKDCTLVAVSKTKPLVDLEEAYQAGQRVFGENKIQEMAGKYEALPKDIEWHMIGHVQTNKVKYMAPFVHLIHSVDSEKLLKEINKQAEKANRNISCLLQLHIAEEETKFGFSEEEIKQLLTENTLQKYPNVTVCGFMGMATNTEDETIVRSEFKQLKGIYDTFKDSLNLKYLSMGMSGDYKIALEEGSNMVRLGSTIFGARNYTNA